MYYGGPVPENLLVAYFYDEEGHGVRRKPSNAADVSRRMLAWFDKYLKGRMTST